MPMFVVFIVILILLNLVRVKNMHRNFGKCNLLSYKICLDVGADANICD